MISFLLEIQRSTPFKVSQFHDSCRFHFHSSYGHLVMQMFLGTRIPHVILNGIRLTVGKDFFVKYHQNTLHVEVILITGESFIAQG